MNVVRVLTYGEAARFASEIGGLEDKTQYRGFDYVHQQNQSRRELFLVGRDDAAISELAKQLAESKKPAGEGLVLSIHLADRGHWEAGASTISRFPKSSTSGDILTKRQATFSLAISPILRTRLGQARFFCHSRHCL